MWKDNIVLDNLKFAWWIKYEKYELEVLRLFQFLNFVSFQLSKHFSDFSNRKLYSNNFNVQLWKVSIFKLGKLIWWQSPSQSQYHFFEQVMNSKLDFESQYRYICDLLQFKLQICTLKKSYVVSIATNMQCRKGNKKWWWHFLHIFYTFYYHFEHFIGAHNNSNMV